MKILLQRVARAEVAVGGETIARIGRGVLLLVGFGREDGDENSPPDLARAAEKIAQLRIFPDEHGKLMHSLRDTGGAALAVPQFTLHGSARKGRRPDFTAALAPDAARAHFEEFVAALKETALRVETGRFGADMRVTLINDGPFTLLMDF